MSYPWPWRVYLPLCKVADTPFHIQGDDVITDLTFWFQQRDRRKHDPLLIWCWTTVYDAGPTSNQQCVNVPCLCHDVYLIQRQPGHCSAHSVLVRLPALTIIAVVVMCACKKIQIYIHIVDVEIFVIYRPFLNFEVCHYKQFPMTVSKLVTLLQFAWFIQ